MPDERDRPEVPAGAGSPVMQYATYLRELADRLASGTVPEPPGSVAAPAASTAGASVTGTPVPGATPPWTLSVTQLQAVLDDIAARRAQVRGLQVQLGAFDEQLGALETGLAPLLEWSRAWAGMEQAVAAFWRPLHPPPADGGKTAR